MPADYIPTKDNLLLAFANNFRMLITASPATYGLDSTAALQVTSEYNTFSAALSTAQNPSTKTKVTIAAKDAAKNILKAGLRLYAQIVQSNPSVSSANKSALGLTIRSNTPTPVPAPGTFPIINVTPKGSLGQQVQFADSGTPSSKRKPTGSKALLLFCHVGPTATTDPTAMQLLAVVTRNPSLQTFAPSQAGMTASYAGRWMTAKGLFGPWSAVVSSTVAQ